MKIYKLASGVRVFGLSLAFLLSACGGGGGGGSSPTPPPSAPSDTTPPTVSTVSPADKSTRITAASVITAQFSEALNCTSFASSSVTVLDGATAVPGTATCSASTVTFTPTSPLPTGTTLAVSIATTVTDLAGNHLASAFSWSFGVAPWTIQTGTASDDGGQAVAVDPAGNVYVVAATSGNFGSDINAGGIDALLIKYNSQGVKQWSREFGTAANDSPDAIAIDASGNIFMSGGISGNLTGSPGATYNGIFVAKFDSTGTQLWIKQLSSGDISLPRSMATDAAGNVAIVGYTQGSLFGAVPNSVDLFVMKMDGSGNVLWGHQSGTGQTDAATGVAIAASGDLYVSGYTYDALDGNTNLGDADAFIAKYDSSGVRQWTHQFGTSGLDIASAITLDSAGNPYVVGRTSGSLSGAASAGGLDVFLAKFDPAGTLQWVQQFGSANDDYASGVAVDGSNNIVLTGYTYGSLPGATSAGGIDAFVAKFDAAGNALWKQQWGTSADDYAYGIAVDASGNSFAAGFTGGALDGNTSAGGVDITVTKFSPTGIKR